MSSSLTPTHPTPPRTGLQELLPNILQQLGGDNISALQKQLAEMQGGKGCVAASLRRTILDSIRLAHAHPPTHRPTDPPTHLP